MIMNPGKIFAAEPTEEERAARRRHMVGVGPGVSYDYYYYE
jgi:hypothetical protein